MPRFVRHPPISPISCREVVELVTAYLDGALDSRTARRVDAHLAVCEACEVYVEQIRATVTGLAQVDLPELPQDVCAGLLEAFRGWRVDGS
jgi:anti-sigma factor RsiW